MGTKNFFIFFVFLLYASLSNYGHALEPDHHHNHHEVIPKKCSRAIETCSPPKAFKHGDVYSDPRLNQFTSNCCRAVSEIGINLDGHQCSSHSFLFQWVKYICENYVTQSPSRARAPPPPPQALPASASCSKFTETCGITTAGPAGPGDHYSYLYAINATCCNVVEGIGNLDGECSQYISILNEIMNICKAQVMPSSPPWARLPHQPSPLAPPQPHIPPPPALKHIDPHPQAPPAVSP